MTPETVARLRRETPACESLLHFNNAGSSLIPDPVHHAMLDYLEAERRMGGYEAEAALATLVVALLTSSPQLAQLTHVVPVVLFGLFYIGSCLTKRPLTEVIIDMIRPGWVARHHWGDADLRAYHRMHVRLCVIVGSLELVQAAAMAGIILRYPVDIAQVVNGLLATAGSAARLAFVIAVIWVFLRRRGHHQASPPRQSQVSEPEGSTPELIGSTCTPSSAAGTMPSAVTTGVVPSQGTQPRAR